MRASEFVNKHTITEIGDNPSEHEPNRRRKRSLFHATVDGQWVDVFFDRSDINGTLHITFTVNDNYEAPQAPSSASRSTIKILSTVMDIIRQRLPEYIKKARPPAVSFTAREASRARLYRKYFVPMVQSILGPKWTLDEYNTMGMTVFNWRPVKKQEVTEASGIRAYHGNQGGIDTEQLHAPMWFTASRRDAEQYAGNDGYVVVVDLDITNPYVIQPGQEEPNTVLHRWQELQTQGYDGIYDRRLGDWIPFTREQIRVISKDDVMKENFAGRRTATGEQVLKYILKTQGESEFRDLLRKEILAIPHWELVNVPLSNLHIPDLDYDEGDEYEVKQDPYGRVLFVDFDYAGEVSSRNIDRLPIVIDSQGHIFDGNHRAWAAAELMMRDSIPAWRPVARTNENFADGKVKGRSRPGRVKRSGASCKGSVTDLRAKARKYGGERGKMYHWCANMKSGKKK